MRLRPSCHLLSLLVGSSFLVGSCWQIGRPQLDKKIDSVGVLHRGPARFFVFCFCFFMRFGRVINVKSRLVYI